MKILLIDDSRMMRGLERAVLMQMGHAEIKESGSGLDALDALRSFEPEVILADCTMPGMGGVAFLTRYRERGGDARVILVATEAEKAAAAECVRMSAADGLVIKPFTPDVLSQRIEESLSRAGVA